MKVVDSRKIIIISLIVVFIALLIGIIKMAFAGTEITVGNADELIAAIETGGNIKLTEDVELNNRISFNNDAILDLNGHSIITTKRIDICANVTIKDTSVKKTGAIKNTADTAATEDLILVGNATDGNFIFESGTIETFGGRYAIWGYKGSMTMNGGKAIGSNHYTFNGSSTFNLTINDGIITSKAEKFTLVLRNTATINGGEISSPGVAIYTTKKLIMNNGKLYSDSGNTIYAYSGADIELNGGELECNGETGIYAIILNENSNLSMKNTKITAKNKSGGIAALTGCTTNIMNSEINSCSTSILNYSNMTVTDGNIYSQNVDAVYLTDNTNVEFNGGVIKTDGERKAALSMGENNTVTVNSTKLISPHGYGVSAFKDSVVTLNNTEINSNSFCACGNGTDAETTTTSTPGNNVKFNINGGTMISESASALYLPQIDGTTTITDGTFKGTSAIEIRAGNLIISKGNFISTADEPESSANGNGSTTRGAAIAIAQHTTKKAINVNISGGTFKGHYALLEHNPQNNSAEDLKKIKISITGGDFYNILEQNEKTVNSIDCNKFITGGTYDKIPDDKYIADGYVTYTIANNRYIVLPVEKIVTNKDEIYLKVGDIFDLNDIILNTNFKEYIELNIPNSSKEIVEGDNLNIEALKEGKAIITLRLGGDTKDITVYSYNAKAADENNEADVNSSSQLLNKIAELLQNPIDTVNGIDKNTSEAIIDAVKRGTIIETELITKDVNIEDKKDDFNIIKENLKDNSEIMEIIDVSILIKADGIEIGKLTELNEAVEFIITIPEDVPKIKDGCTRIYSVVRVHNGELEVVAENLTETNKEIKVRSDKFSTYVLLYRDIEKPVNPENPSNTAINNIKTGDIIAIWFATIAVAFIGILKIKQVKAKIRGKHTRKK